MVAGEHVWLLRGMHGKGGDCVVKGEGCMAKGVCGKGAHALDTTRYGDTINERAVRILLECILVS